MNGVVRSNRSKGANRRRSIRILSKIGEDLLISWLLMILRLKRSWGRDLGVEWASGGEEEVIWCVRGYWAESGLIWLCEICETCDWEREREGDSLRRHCCCGCGMSWGCWWFSWFSWFIWIWLRCWALLGLLVQRLAEYSMLSSVGKAAVVVELIFLLHLNLLLLFCLHFQYCIMLCMSLCWCLRRGLCLGLGLSLLSLSKPAFIPRFYKFSKAMFWMNCGFILWFCKCWFCM